MSFLCLLRQELGWLLGMKIQLLRILPFVTESVQHQRLLEILRHYLHSLSSQQERLQEIGKIAGVDVEEVICLPVQALIVDLHEVINTQPASPLRDLMLANKLRLIKNYETIGYQKAFQYAQRLKSSQLSALLDTAKQSEESVEFDLTMMVTSNLTIRPGALSEET